jgi:outer membrane receptor protein involved in Fe transport
MTVAGCAVIVSNVALAQLGSGSAPQQASDAIGEIVVTAQKREQRAEDVGITMDVASAQQLQNEGITDVTELGKVVPGFTATPTFAGFPVFSLRGVNFTGGQLSAPPAVSVYLNEAPLPYSTMTGNLLLDPERVEVLKGPQGTLFGENSTGGSINVIAAQPTAVFSAGMRGEVNNFGQTMLEGYVSGPLTEQLRARFAITTTQFGDWQHGYYLNDQKNGSQNKMGARLLLDWTPLDKLKISVNVNGDYDHGEAPQDQLYVISPANPAGATPGLLGYPLPSNARDADFDPGFNTHMRNSLFQGVLRADYEINDFLTFTSLTDYVDSKTSIPIDLDGTALDIITANYGGQVQTINQEFRLSGSVPAANIHYIVGANYEHDSSTEAQPTQFANYSGLPPGAELEPYYQTGNRAAAAFGNVDYEIIPQVTLTTGVRYTETKQTRFGCTLGNATGTAVAGGVANLLRGIEGLPPTDEFVSGGCATIDNTGAAPTYLPADANLEQKQNNTSWRGGINYKPTPDSLIYATVSRGYKAGVFPTVITLFLSATDSPVRQEELTSYEVGAKLPFFERRVLINASVFYYDYINKQFYTYVPIPPIGAFSTLINIPKSRDWGADLDITARPFEALTLRAAMTYLNTAIGNYEGFDLNGKAENFSGKEFNFAPPVSATLDAEYVAPLGDQLQGYLGGGALYNDRTFSDLGESALSRVPTYAVFDARLGVRSGSKWSAGFWIRNLANKYYWTGIVTGGDSYNRTAGLPRTFGVNASYTF